jgi:hypothetical protein
MIHVVMNFRIPVSTGVDFHDRLLVRASVSHYYQGLPTCSLYRHMDITQEKNFFIYQ